MSETPRLRVLLADDRSDHRRLIRGMLTDWGFAVESVQSEKEAKQLIGKQRFDLAVIDLVMEHADSGFVLSYLLKKKNPDTHIIMLMELTSDTDFYFEVSSPSERAWLKADTVLDKPLRPDQLQTEINHVFGQDVIGVESATH